MRTDGSTSASSPTRFSVRATSHFAAFFIIAIGAFLYALMSSGRWDQVSLVLPLLVVTSLVGESILRSEWKQTLRRFQALFIAGFSFWLAYFLFGATLHAGFSLIDDHQIVHYVGADGRMSLSEYPALLFETEVGRPGEFPRYRPSYYAVRIAEAFFWGPSPFLWYLARLGIATVTMVIIWTLLKKYAGFLAAGLLVCYFFSYSFWADVFTRLGPSEGYAVLGCSIFALGFVSLIQRKGDQREQRSIVLGWILVTVGSLIAIGSKENFLILLPALYLLMVLAFRQKAGRSTALACTVGVSSYSILVAWAVLTALSDVGVTIHAEPVTVANRMALTVDAVKTPAGTMLTALLLGLGLAWVLTRTNERYQRLNRLCLNAIIGIGACFTLYFSQYLFYSGEWPVGNRYDFPGILYRPFAYLILAWFAAETLEVAGAGLASQAGLRYGLIVGLSLLIMPTDFALVRESSSNRVKNTRIFAAQLESVVKTLEQHPDAVLMLESHQVRDYERIYSWPRFIRARGTMNPLFLRLHGYSSKTAAPGLDQILARGLEETLKEGRGEVSPFYELQNHNGPCFSLNVSSGRLDACPP